ncbi:MAG TPA: hypothetical protein P5079_00985 [Elusimicrobiota bacterium]|nr:hypothetical protein [Elusimicrobiota bacterium]
MAAPAGFRVLPMNATKFEEQIFCLWNLADRCNFGCPYCGYVGEWVPEPAELSAAEWIGFWDRAHSLYGPMNIGVAGKVEPFLTKDFFEILRSVSEKHTLSITTNLSWEPDEWLPALRPGRVRLHASFHPYFISHDTLLQKILSLKARGIGVMTSMVAYPPLLNDIRTYYDGFRRHGVLCWIRPFHGKYQGKQYPAAHSPEEKELIRMGGDDKAVRYQIWDIRTKDKMCRAGQKGFVLAADGSLRRCPNANEPFGNAKDPTFRLLDAPRPCPVDRCTCAALAPCLVENDAQRLRDDRYVRPVGAAGKKAPALVRRDCHSRENAP